MMLIRRLGLALAVAVLPLPALDAQDNAEYKIIAHPSNAVVSLTQTEVSRLFLKKTTFWKGGGTVAPADLVEDSATRRTFSRTVHGKTVGAIKSYWQQQIFSGSDVPPPEFPTDAEVLAFVRARPGAIGYASAAADLTGVKAIKVVK